MSKVWLVTGSASGLGRNIAEAVLASGDRLVATARDPHRLEDLVEKHGDQVRTALLDVADEDAAYDFHDVPALMGQALHDTVRTPKIAENFDCLPAQLLDRVRRLRHPEPGQ